jgi:erythrin-vacuolar iron transport family protein
MGLSEALSDDGIVTSRGTTPARNHHRRGDLHRGNASPSPFLISNLNVALDLAYAVVTCQLFAIAFIRYRFMGGRLLNTIVQVVIVGALVFAIGVWLGHIGVA